MKRMEMKIAVTFLLVFVVGAGINVVYSVVSMNSSFFTFDVLANGLITALFYLVYIWINTRRHQLLAALGVVCIGLVIIFIIFSSEGVAGSFSTWNWKDTIMCIFYMVLYPIASYQGAKLLEEDNQAINIRLFLNGEKVEAENTEITVN